MVFKEAHFLLIQMPPVALGAHWLFISDPTYLQGAPCQEPRLLLIWGPSSLQGTPAGDCGVLLGPQTRS